MSKRSELKQEALPEPFDGFKKFHTDMIAYLFADHGETYNKNMKNIEEGTGLKREQIIYVLIGLNCIYLILGSWAEFVCNLIGFAYPAYVSVKAIRTTDTADDTQWLTYWAVFATFALVDFFAIGIMSVFPFYWVVKAAFLMYLYLPQTQGAKVMYVKVVDPLVTFIDTFIEPSSQQTKINEKKSE
ncbi:unnamed protein product [Caenorhabditis bovis]|uniref:Receptor expression-enhancing protein n=1 Tax=Caenorhabditis bovis TaxID=2654633 RepID=A0A8S1ECR0_9PELO|nr:unnamed protein product [Caenorhabditis bovis]